MRLHLTARALRSAAVGSFNIISALHPPPQRRQVRRVVRTMKAKLIELLLSSPSGKAVREALQLAKYAEKI
jgi:hypothetical protein